MSSSKRITKQALAAARRAALAGDAETALAELEWMVLAGSASAAASAAELHAFRGEWDRVVVCAGMLIADPSAVYAGNVIDDMVELLGYAGSKGANWSEVGAVAQTALEHAGSEEREHLRERYTAMFGRLREYSQRTGAAPHDLVRLPGELPAAPDPSGYEPAVDAALELRPDLVDKPDALARHCFALAVSYRRADEIVRRFDATPDLMDFAAACEAARCLLADDETERAWSVLEPRIAQWWPVDSAQVAPVVLLTDRALRLLATPERCARVLATPRGKAALAR